MKRTYPEPKEIKPFSYISAAVFLYVLCFIPLYVENRYFNILQAKGHAFNAGCIAACVLILISIIWDRDITKIKPKKSLVDIGYIILAFSALISCVLCGSFKEAFWGEQAWCVGGFAFLMAAILYLYMSKSFNISQNLWLPVIAVTCFILVLGLLHSVWIDVLGLHENIVRKQYNQYISTIGNVNWYVGYLGLLMPIFACFYTEAKGKVSQTIYLVVLILGELNMVLTGSDGMFLSIGVCAFFGIPYMFRSRSSSFRVSILLLIYGLETMMVSLHPLFRKKRQVIHGLAEDFLNPKVFIVIIAAGIIGIIVFSLIKEDFAKKLCRWLIIAFEVILGAAALIFFIKTIKSFGPEWGSGRGSIWIAAADIYVNFDPLHKLFGVGPEMLGKYFAQYDIVNSRRVLAAHSEPLQILLSTGAIGLTGWLLMWAGLIRRFFINKLSKASEIAYFLPLMAYLGQSLVNTPMATNWAILIVMISLFVYNSDKG